MSWLSASQQASPSQTTVAVTRAAARLVAVGLVTTLFLGLTGCLAARKDQRRYFSLPPMSAVKSHKDARPGTLLVATFDASAVHDRVAMVLRRSNVEVHYSARYVWVKRPQVLVSERVAEALVRANVVSHVVRDLGRQAPDWVLRGKVLAMEVLTGPDGGGPWRVRVALRMSLRDAKRGDVLWRQAWSQTADVSIPQAGAAARKMGGLLDKGLSELLSPLKRAMRAAK